MAFGKVLTLINLLNKTHEKSKKTIGCAIISAYDSLSKRGAIAVSRI
jgi:hypothetical protein